MSQLTTSRDQEFGRRHLRDATGWLRLAASPTFALMAWVSASEVQAMICVTAPGNPSIGGMVWMYLLMCLFHLPPWLRLASALSRRLLDPTPQT